MPSIQRERCRSAWSLYNPMEMHSSSSTTKALPLSNVTAIFLFLIVLKFLLPLVMYDLPLGYDPGIYRYLFVRHADGFPPFVLGQMDAWAHSHPLGLFIFSTALLRAGLPVDWLVGWIWNVMAIVVICTLAYVTSKREGKTVGVCVLLAGALSAPYYDGFSAMYWKAYLALLFMVLAFHLIDKKSWWAVIPATHTRATHNQTGLLFALVIGTWWLLLGLEYRKHPQWQKATLVGAVFLVISALVYLPVWQEAVWTHVETLLTLRGDNVPAGAFPPRIFYLQMNCLLLLAGVFGFLHTLHRDRSVTPWSIAVLWSAAFVIFKLFFYRRFFLHLDFFLLPFAAYGLIVAWNRFKNVFWRALLIGLIVGQAYLSYDSFMLRKPDIDVEMFNAVKSIESVELPDDAFVLTLENKSTTWLRGWLPNHRVAGPGLFSLSWPYEDWIALFYGSNDQRKILLGKLDGTVYFLLTPLFYEHYGEFADAFVADPCFEKLDNAPLLKVTCT